MGQEAETALMNAITLAVELYSFGLDYGAPSWRPIRPLTFWKLVPETPPVQQKLELNLKKVCCNKHIQKVEKVKQKLWCVPGVTDVQANIGKSKVTVFGKVDRAIVLKVVRKVFPSAEVEDLSQDNPKSNSSSNNDEDDDASKLWKYHPLCLPPVPIVPIYPCTPINYYYPYPCNDVWYPESFQYYYPLPPQNYLY
ncbi:unnamed protein product [Sphagnum jensenii]|uniref:HMA domain-containing protein n=1 Tax=Sphagnum jensenii TaxID=128206 RepID=A0ABP1B903_9BRYO